MPNSTIAKSKIVNVSSPSGIHGVSITIQVGGETLPSAAAEILRHAILNCRSIVAGPAPVVATKTINAAYGEFEITFFVEELATSGKAQNELIDWIYRHLTAAGIALASPQDSPSAASNFDAATRARAHTEIVLDWVEIFATLSVAERAEIAAKLSERSHDEGEALLEPGTVSQSLFIIANGVASLVRPDDEGEKEVLRLGPGDHFGEVALLTGAPATGRITALTPVTLYELAKDELAPILAARQSVAHELSRALARRQAAGRATAEGKLDAGVPAHRLAGWFAGRLRRLHDIAGAS